ncbi:MAG: S8 family serine peptidase, partial [Ilumatobacteraceae bacterium]
FGTSAAAPHAAAAAALLLEQSPMLTPADVLDVLQSTATDIEGPGFDDYSGAGVVNLDAPGPSLTVKKVVVNDDGGTAAPGDFTMNVSGSNVSSPSFPGAASGTVLTLDPGEFEVTETGPAGYTAEFSAECSGGLSLGQDKVCTVTNDDIDDALLVPVDPFRFEDTRQSGLKVGSADGSAGPLRFNVLGRGNLPLSGVKAVSLNVTVTQGELPDVGGGFVTVDGCSASRPNASNLNFGEGQTVPNAVITPVSPSGDVCVYVYGTSHILVDVNGYFPSESDFDEVEPFRLEDTRGSAKVGSDDGSAGPLRFNVLGRGGLPASGVGAVSLNVTVTQGELPEAGGGFVTVDGCATPRPNASNLNFGEGDTVPNAVITPVSPTGDVCVYVYGTSHILVDINGYFPED